MDLQEIGDYTADDLQAPDAAVKLIEDISEAVLSLDLYPERSPVVADEELKRQGVHWIRCRQYIIFFSIGKDDRIVHILRILHEKRNWKHLLKCLSSSSYNIPWK